MNKKIILGLGAIAAFGLAGQANAQTNSAKNDLQKVDQGYHSFSDQYQNMKNQLSKDFGLTYDGTISILGQRGSPSGKITPFQVQYSGDVNWDAFQSDTIGSGSFQVSYTSNRYMRHTKDGNALASNIGVVDPLNDYPSNQNYFNQLTYTHEMPGDFNWLSVTFGQFPMYNFDGNPYAANQQTQFINNVFAQNGTDTYPSASIGGFVTITPNSEWTASIGYQDAHNILGNDIKTNTAFDGKYTSFGYLAYTPTIKGLGQGFYSVTVYHQPSVEQQPGSSTGWSLNMAQDLGEKWAVFSRINNSSNHIATVEQSYLLGGVYKDPFDRNSLDGIGLAGSINKVNEDAATTSRQWETVFEAYYNFGVGNNLLFTPDVQMYLNPASSNSDTAYVYSLRATLLF